MDNMFTFDDLNKIDDKGHAGRAQGSAVRSPGAGSQGASPELREKIFRNMSTRAAETLRGTSNPAAPCGSRGRGRAKEMLKIVRRLVDEGQIVLATGGDDQFI